MWEASGLDGGARRWPIVARAAFAERKATIGEPTRKDGEDMTREDTYGFATTLRVGRERTCLRVGRGRMCL
ncbi:MAG TPA: hypothetical protein DD670_10605 [Planctomycetaceae bacterium]|nr:hypothetical protein [Planctomycetaceae bacterium]